MKQSSDDALTPATLPVNYRSTMSTESDTSHNSDDDISRHPGTGVGGFIVGGGYHGKRDDQDEAVQEFAERLNEEFPDHDIEIRYNTDQLSGGAWLVDNEDSTQVSLGAELCPPEWHKALFEAYTWGDRDEKPPKPSTLDPDELNLRYTVKLTVPAIKERFCNKMTDRDDRKSYRTRSFRSLEAAWGYFEYALEREHVNPPAEA